MQADLCEFKPSLVYRVSSKSAGTKGRPCLKKAKKNSFYHILIFLACLIIGFLFFNFIYLFSVWMYHLHVGLCTRVVQCHGEGDKSNTIKLYYLNITEIKTCKQLNETVQNKMNLYNVHILHSSNDMDSNPCFPYLPDLELLKWDIQILESRSRFLLCNSLPVLILIEHPWACAAEEGGGSFRRSYGWENRHHG